MSINRRGVAPVAVLVVAGTIAAAAVVHTAPVVADHTTPPASVTLAGSFQSELGCPGDWQPECATTQLALEDDVWQGTQTVPAGSWEYKAALNLTWDESYGGPGGANIPLTLAAGTAVRFYYSHDTHWVADSVNDRIATAAGSFQSELGCSGDWQPDCLRSWLQDPDGNGVYELRTTEIPAGSYEWKVAIAEAWDESYGGPGGANLAFTVASDDQPVTFRFDSSANAPTVVIGDGSGLEPGEEDLVTAPVRTSAADEVVYFVMTDRFADGAPGNNRGGSASDDRLVHGYDPTGKGWYHGGDLAGLRSKLGYLDDLGITALWVTPPFTNRWVQGTSAGYHGYWQVDYTQIDPHLGTNAEMVDLVDAAHDLGMKVYFDIVLNHTADVISYDHSGTFTYRNKADYPYRDASGAIFDDSDYANDPDFPAVDAATSFPYRPVFETAADETAKSPAWLNDPTVYHNRGESTFAGESSLYGDFVGLDDLFTERPDVVTGMIDIHANMIREFGIDGFRVDTVKHVNDELWEAFVPAVQAVALAEGKTEFSIFGEVFDGNPTFLSRFSTELPFPSTLDFRFNGTVAGIAANSAATDSLRGLFADDDWFTDTDSNAGGLTKFVGNHDIGRVGRSVAAANPGASDDELVARARLAQVLNFTTRGTPVVYYGDEQGFTGDGGDQDARQDMFPSQVASYNDDDLIGTDATTADDNFDPDHPLYEAISELAALRADHTALRQGAQLDRASESSAGIYAFSRIERAEQVEYVVAINNSEAADSATFRTDTPSTTFTPILPAGDPAITSGADGSITVAVGPLDAVVYRADAPIGIDTTPDLINVTAPAAGAEVTGRVPVRADVGGGNHAEVTFAVSVGGAPLEVLGVDDNAPYAVYHDVASLAPGTPVRYRAIVADAAGNLNAAGVAAVVGEEEPPPGPGDGESKYAVVHYQRADGAYDDWGLHAWGDIAETIEWTSPKPFAGEDEYGRFAWVELNPGARQMGLIAHRGDEKDPPAAPDRFIDPSITPEVWLKSGDLTIYTSQAAADGFATIRYHRPDGVYDGWGLHLWGDAIAPGDVTEWTAPRLPDGVDEFGAFWEVPLVDVDQPLNFIIHRGDEKDPGPDQSIVPAEQPSAWIASGDETIHRTRGSALDVATIHYHRPAGDYGDATSPNFNDFWGLHVWAGAATPNPSWDQPVRPARTDPFGIVFEVPLTADATGLAHIIHRGDVKDPGPDMFLDLGTYGHEVWQLQGADPLRPYVLPIVRSTGGGGDLGQQRAYWVDDDTILWDAASDATATYRLHHAPTGGLALTDAGVSGDSIVLTRGAVDPAVFQKFPHLTGTPALKIAPDDVDAVRALLREQVAVAATSAGGVRLDATGLQIPGVLDDLFAYDGDLGVTWDGDTPTLRLWAPTARNVELQLFADGDPANTPTMVEMTGDTETGVWSVTGEPSWRGRYYRYDVEVYVPSLDAVTHNVVTDPYSLSLATDSQRSQIVDLDDPALAPDGWADVAKPSLAAPEDLALYELHVRDFSAGDTTVPEPLRGTYGAFTVEESAGMQHLAALADAGLGAVHLLPVFDIATIAEDRSTWQQPDPAVLANYPPDSDQQQAAVNATRALDGFNWGYDPWHYTAPEGSYATDPEGATRIVEFRDMVAALNETGLRVVMDVVYNHTTAGGQDPKSVLDRVVPGYYHRLNDVGVIETSTCCANTASEHAMMEKLLIDSVVTWAREYKVDGFRFDLMGHHSRSTLLKLRAALDELTVADDGVDGAAVYLYGEGWNFGEVANNARFVQATQLNMGGTGIGTFNDRLRDAVRGGGPFDGAEGLVRNQGVINGLWYDPNELVATSGLPSEDDQLEELLLSADQIRVGLAGNLADYEFVDRNGDTVTGAEVDYNGAPAGYTDDPQEHIVYVEAHDNQTLFDIGQYHHPLDTSTADRVRAQNAGLDFTVLAQGVPFVHAGEELLRSKSMDRNSYDSGDWFNRLDLSGQESTWGSGLPMAADNQGDWPLIGPRLAGLPAPEAGDMAASSEHLRELLAIRGASPLFRLRTAAEVQERLAFANTGPDQVPGLIVMTLDDPAAEPLTTGDLDTDADRLAVLFNPTGDEMTYTVASWAGEDGVALHPVQAASADPVVGEAAFDAATGSFTIPPRTTAVFVDATDDTTPPTVTAELRRASGGPTMGAYVVLMSCTDDTSTAAELTLTGDVNGTPVVHAGILLLIVTPTRHPPARVGNLTIMWGPSFTLTATCTDAAGNTATATAQAVFRR